MSVCAHMCRKAKGGKRKKGHREGNKRRGPGRWKEFSLHCRCPVPESVFFKRCSVLVRVPHSGVPTSPCRSAFSLPPHLLLITLTWWPHPRCYLLTSITANAQSCYNTRLLSRSQNTGRHVILKKGPYLTARSLAPYR